MPPPTNTDSRSPPTNSLVMRSPFHHESTNSRQLREQSEDDCAAIYSRRYHHTVLQSLEEENGATLSRDSLDPPPASYASKSGFVGGLYSNNDCAEDNHRSHPA